ncbi:MAG TPA: hypothetical protein VEC35_09215 [Noviherbaspirillum sp.]|nr:hypothetical protein [Noviherbaspirillum sp.]
MSELNNKERDALKAVSEALVKIRELANAPMTAKSQRAIFDLADAFHNRKPE